VVLEAKKQELKKDTTTEVEETVSVKTGGFLKKTKTL
jgi:hypothetical protein